MRAFYRTLRILSAVTLFFFSWTFLPLWQVAAYAAEKPSTRGRGDTETRGKNQGPATSGERFEKALEDIRENVGKAEKRHERGEDDIAEREQIRTKRADIESADSEFRKELAATEKKLKDAKLPQEILDQHYKFVKHYEDNLKELKTNLDAIEKPSAESRERRAAFAKAKTHLEKTKTPSKHVPLDPNKLPHRMGKGKERAPRLKKEEFEKDFPKQRSKGAPRTAGIMDAEGREWMRIALAAASTSLRSPFAKGGYGESSSNPILLASNAPVSDMPLQLPRPSAEIGSVPEWFNRGRRGDLIPQLEFPVSEPPMLAQAIVDLPTADDLAETPEVQFTAELRQIATLLENNPVQLYEFVRNNFTYDPYYGSIKGSQGTLLLQNGNDIDQASVLIGLFRVSGIPARYANGTVEIPIEKVMKWLGGITDPRTAGTVLTTNGIPAKLIISGGAIKSVQLEHTWIEVYIPYANYRGLINDPASSRTWIPLDPSFKLIESNPDTTDLADIQQFDIDSYLASYLQTVKPSTPAKEYLKNTIDYVTANIQGKRFYDLLVSNTIADKVLGLLPDTLPYPVKTVGTKFFAIPDSYRHRIALECTAPNTNNTVLNYTASWTSVLHNRFTLSYAPATAADEQIIANYGDIYSTPSYLIQVKPVLTVEGVAVAEGTVVPMASDLTCRMNFVWPDGTTDKAVINSLVAGAPYAIGLGSGYTTGRIVTKRTAKLEAAVSAGAKGEPIIGEYLNLFAVNYLQELDSSRQLIAKSMKMLDTNRMAELMVGVELGVSAVFGIPEAVAIRGVLIDVDYNIATPVNIDGAQSKVRRFQILTGMTSSALEHSMFGTIIGVEAISTIKALEIANAQGIPVHKIDAENVATKLALLQVGNEIEADIINAVNAGKVITISERKVQLNNWNGIGYIILDPTTGAGAYMISSRISGGSLTQMTQGLKYMISTGEIKDNSEASNIIAAHKCVIWFPMPAIGPISSYFNSPRKYKGVVTIHGAVDIKVPNWTPVIAVADGKVLTVKTPDVYTSDTGYYVVIDHGAGVKTRYLHNCHITVQENQGIKEGQQIALSGNTGSIESDFISDTSNYPRCNSDEHFGSHLHFELLLDGDKVDPALYGKWENSTCGVAN